MKKNTKNRILKFRIPEFEKDIQPPVKPILSDEEKKLVQILSEIIVDTTLKKAKQMKF